VAGNRRQGNAALMISGDKDLLQLKSFRNIPIVTPAQFVESLAE
jgi:predicted nucleic acid-binding protein